MMNLNECLIAEKDKEIAELKAHVERLQLESQEHDRLKKEAAALHESYIEEYNFRRREEYTPKVELALVIRRISIYLLDGLREEAPNNLTNGDDITQTNSEAG